MALEFSDWVIYCFDSAVFAFVGSVEGLLQETYSFGNGVSQPRYTLKQLLADDFRVDGSGTPASDDVIFNGKVEDGFYDEVGE